MPAGTPADRADVTTYRSEPICSPFALGLFLTLVILLLRPGPSTASVDLGLIGEHWEPPGSAVGVLGDRSPVASGT